MGLLSFIRNWRWRRNYFKECQTIKKYEDQIKAGKCSKCGSVIQYIQREIDGKIVYECWECANCKWQLHKHAIGYSIDPQIIEYLKNNPWVNDTNSSFEDIGEVDKKD
jgi:hypothetical protein